MRPQMRRHILLTLQHCTSSQALSQLEWNYASMAKYDQQLIKDARESRNGNGITRVLLAYDYGHSECRMFMRQTCGVTPCAHATLCANAFRFAQ